MLKGVDEPNPKADALRRRFGAASSRLWGPRRGRAWRNRFLVIAGLAVAGGLASDPRLFDRFWRGYAPRQPRVNALSPLPSAGSQAGTSWSLVGIAFRNCAEARAAGYQSIRRGQPGYAEHLDRDKDGIACEPLPSWKW